MVDVVAMRVQRNGALEEAAIVADKFARANAVLNTNEQEAAASIAVANAVAKEIRALKS